MAEYLISRLKLPFGCKPFILVDFDARKVLVNENKNSFMNFRRDSGFFKYSKVNQKTLDAHILSPLSSKEQRKIIESKKA